MARSDFYYKAIYQLSRGRLGHEVPGGRRVLLLTTVGRRTGKRRTTPLVYMPLTSTTPGAKLSGTEGFLIAGSNWGGATDPAWLLNLMASATGRIRAGAQQLDVTARPVSSNDAELLWPVACEYNDHWAGYRESCEREIPLVVLEPAH